MHPVQFVVATILYFILFFGVSFLLNMLLRTTWIPAIILYPIVVVLFVSDVSVWQYVVQPLDSLQHLGNRFVTINWVDYVTLIAGWVGAFIGGYVITLLRKKGYRMF